MHVRCARTRIHIHHKSQLTSNNPATSTLEALSMSVSFSALSFLSRASSASSSSMSECVIPFVFPRCSCCTRTHAHPNGRVGVWVKQRVKKMPKTRVRMQPGAKHKHNRERKNVLRGTKKRAAVCCSATVSGWAGAKRKKYYHAIKYNACIRKYA